MIQSTKLNKKRKSQGIFSKIMNNFMKSPLISSFNNTNFLQRKLSLNVHKVADKKNIKNQSHTCNASAKRSSRTMNSRLFQANTIGSKKHKEHIESSYIQKHISNKFSRQNSTRCIKLVKTKVNSINSSQAFDLSISRQSLSSNYELFEETYKNKIEKGCLSKVMIDRDEQLLKLLNLERDTVSKLVILKRKLI